MKILSLIYLQRGLSIGDFAHLLKIIKVSKAKCSNFNSLNTKIVRQVNSGVMI